MGYDVTFHSITRDELKHFIQEPFMDRNVIPDRVMLLTRGDKTTHRIDELYRRMTNLVDEPNSDFDLADTIRFGTAIIAGYLHPYWYTRNQALSLLPQSDFNVRCLFSPLSSCVQLPFKMEEENLGFQGNYSASALIGMEQFSFVEGILNSVKFGRHFDAERTLFDEDGERALRNAIDYARTKRAVLIEATDVVIPISNQSMAPLRNLRAQFIGRMGP